MRMQSHTASTPSSTATASSYWTTAPSRNSIRLRTSSRVRASSTSLSVSRDCWGKWIARAAYNRFAKVSLGWMGWNKIDYDNPDDTFTIPAVSGLK